MANPAGLDAWLKYADETARTPEERAQMRADIYKRFGVQPPKRKRGGLAGIWDRNKNIIVPVVSGLAGLLTGGAAAPLVSSLAGATMRGLDTGSLKGALRGAGEGYLSGLGASAIGGAVKGGMAGTGLGGTISGAAKGAVQGGRAYLPGGGGAGGGTTTSQAQRVLDPSRGGYVDVGGVAGGTPQASSKLAGLLKPEAIGGITAGAGQALGGYMEREAGLQRLNFEEEQRKIEQERANRLAQLLAPMAGAQAGMVGAQYGGYGRMG